MHQADFVRPTIERVERFEQIFRVVADLEEPLGQFALFDFGSRAPAATIDDLFVGEHGLIDRIPVHFRLLALDQSHLEKIEKHLLLMLVVGGIARRDLARPIERQPHRLKLLFHRRDVVVGPGFRVHLAVNGRVLCRHAEGIPTHWMQHGTTHGPFETRNHIAHCIVAHVTHMNAPRRVGEHLKHVIFRPGVVVFGREDAPLGPRSLPADLCLSGVVTLVFNRIGGHLRVLVWRAEQTRKRPEGQPVDNISR